MPHAAAFDPERFAFILKTEVEDISTNRYGGTSDAHVGKAFAFWCIKNISPSLRDEEIESARGICDPGGPGDEDIDGAWISGDRFFLIQAKFSRPELPTDEEEEFNPPSFPADAAEQLENGFHRLRMHIDSSNVTPPSRKLVELGELYTRALNSHLRISLIVAISGRPRKKLLDKVGEINHDFDSNRAQFQKHHCDVYDLDELNQLVSDNRAAPPGTLYLDVVDQFTLKNPDGSIYAVACTVEAPELIRIRNEFGYNIYHSNFRFLLTRGVARPKIDHTLQDSSERKNFWRYNNGITVACETVRPAPGAVDKLEVRGLQVVNGLQTIEALYENRSYDQRTEDVQVLVRIIPTAQPSQATVNARELEERIAEYSNSQTPIRARDLRSNDAVQIEVERVLREVYGLKYVRKVGEGPGFRGRPSRKRVDNEKAAQAALAFWHGYGNEAKTKRKLIFERTTSAPPGFYEMVFGENTTAEYVLLPYLFYENEYTFIPRAPNKTIRGIYRSLDLMALAIVGDAFKSLMSIGPNPNRSDDAIAIVKSAIDSLQRSGSRKTLALWRVVFKLLHETEETKRQVEATRAGVPLQQVQPRNVIVKMRYTDPHLRSELARNSQNANIARMVNRIFHSS